MLALGGPLKEDNPEAYLRQANKKLSKLRKATDLFLEIQPEVSVHTNLQMATVSLSTAVREIERILSSN